jgi:hypothetical protein
MSKFSRSVSQAGSRLLAPHHAAIERCVILLFSYDTTLAKVTANTEVHACCRPLSGVF